MPSDLIFPYFLWHQELLSLVTANSLWPNILLEEVLVWCAYSPQTDCFHMVYSVVECWPSKHDALSSIPAPQTSKQKKNKNTKKQKKNIFTTSHFPKSVGQCQPINFLSRKFFLYTPVYCQIMLFLLHIIT